MIKVWEILDNYMIREEVIRDQRWVNLYPSEASVIRENKWGEKEVQGTCQRQAWLRFKTMEQLNNGSDETIAILQVGDDVITVKPERQEPRKEWIFEEGRRIEDTIISVAAKAGILAAGHRKFVIPIGDGLNLSGELDCIFRVHDELLGIEVKSVSGYNAEKDIFGTASMRRNNVKGDPKIAHLLQTAVYTWHYRDKISRFKIIYFMRGNCLREEFEVTLEEDINTGDWHIMVDGKDSGVTINQILDRYRELARKLRDNELPPREYKLVYDDETMNKFAERKDSRLNKTVREAWLKYWDRKQDPEARQLKRPEKGDMWCSFCKYRDICYNKKKEPIPYGTHDQVLHADMASETSIDDGLRCRDSRGGSEDLQQESNEGNQAAENDAPSES
jgi:hypothetical protein